jgi:hypothetical protein
LSRANAPRAGLGFFRGTLFALLVVACAGRSPPEFTAVAVSVSDEDLSELVQAALQADALLEIPDSLYTDEAPVVSDGVERLAPPRFAGVGLGGSVAVTSTRFDVRSGVAWAYVAYRWMSEGGSEVREGRATIVLLVTSGAWRIRHAHSSTPGESRPGGV